MLRYRGSVHLEGVFIWRVISSSCKSGKDSEIREKYPSNHYNKNDCPILFLLSARNRPSLLKNGSIYCILNFITENERDSSTNGK